MSARISIAEARRLGARLPPRQRALLDAERAAAPAKPNKYRAQRATASDGRSFASKAERDRYEQLRLAERAGEIADLRCQVAYHFPINGRLLTVNGRTARYTADFCYRVPRTGEQVVEDTKGFLTNDAALRIGLMLAVHGIEVRLTHAPGSRRKGVPPGATPRTRKGPAAATAGPSRQQPLTVSKKATHA